MNKKILNLYTKSKRDLSVKLENFTESSSKLANFILPIECIIGIRRAIIVNLSIDFPLNVEFNLSNDFSFPILYSYAIDSGSSNSFVEILGTTAKAISTGNISGIKIGSKTDANTTTQYKAFLPFYVDISNISLGTTSACGLAIDSAKLILTSQTDSEFLNKNLILDIGVDTINSASPVSAADLSSRAFNKVASKKSYNINYNWESGEQYEFDVTDIISQAMGNQYVLYNGSISGTNFDKAIGWTSGSLNLLLMPSAPLNPAVDDSTTRVFYSYSSAITANSNPAILEINFKRNSYFNYVEDTYIQNSLSTTQFNASASIVIGKNGTSYTARGLVRFNFSELPSPSLITVTSASLCLYHSQYVNKNKLGTLSVHELLKEPDFLSSTWSYRYNRKAWGTAGGQSGVDYAASTMGTKSLTATESNGYKIIPITDTTTVQDWVDNPGNNFGMLLKMDEPSTSDVYAHYWVSVEANQTDKSPYFQVAYTYGGNNYIATIRSTGTTITSV